MYKTLQEFERDGFSITVEVCAEDMALQDCYDDSCYDIQDMVRKVDYGMLDWFKVRVRAHVAGVELGRAHVGGCLYADCADVLCDGVAEDLIQEALEIARETASKLQHELPLAA